MKARLLIIAILFSPALVIAWPWSTDMMDQPSIKPQEGVMTPFPARSIPASGIPTRIATREEAKTLKNPIPASGQSLKIGKTLFKIYCSACHGLTGKADAASPVSSKIGAISLVDDYVQNNLTEGWIYGTITLGSYVMPAYGAPALRPDKRGSNDLSVEERWHVVNYVKHGLSKDAAAEVEVKTATK